MPVSNQHWKDIVEFFVNINISEKEISYKEQEKFCMRAVQYQQYNLNLGFIIQVSEIKYPFPIITIQV